MAYQSFAPGAGASDSEAKLVAVKLPDLAGKTVLDLGCNEGFFCFAALERGAAYVTGIDRNPAHIASAKERAKYLSVDDRARFINADWKDAPDETFDVVFLFSALHYAPDQPAFIAKIASLLKPGGLFVLEAGIANSGEAWSSITRGRNPIKGTVQYPNRAQMLKMLRLHFAPRLIGTSVMQKGDPVQRYVLHCQKIMRTIICIAGRAATGKSTLAQFLNAKQVPVLATDHFLVTLAKGTGALPDAVREHFRAGALAMTYKAIVTAGLSEQVSNALIDSIDANYQDDRLVAVEGSLLRHPAFLDAFRNGCEKRAIVVWVTNRIGTNSAPANRVPVETMQEDHEVSSEAGAAEIKEDELWLYDTGSGRSSVDDSHMGAEKNTVPATANHEASDEGRGRAKSDRASSQRESSIDQEDSKLAARRNARDRLAYVRIRLQEIAEERERLIAERNRLLGERKEGREGE